MKEDQGNSKERNYLVVHAYINSAVLLKWEDGKARQGYTVSSHFNTKQNRTELSASDLLCS